MRVLAADESSVEHALHLDVARVTGSAAHLVQGVVTRNPHADGPRIDIDIRSSARALLFHRIPNKAVVFRLPARLLLDGSERKLFAFRLFPVSDGQTITSPDGLSRYAKTQYTPFREGRENNRAMPPSPDKGRLDGGRTMLHRIHRLRRLSVRPRRRTHVRRRSRD